MHSRRIYHVPEPAGFVVLCQLGRVLSLVCGFCMSARTFAAVFLQMVGRPSALAFGSYF